MSRSQIPLPKIVSPMNPRGASLEASSDRRGRKRYAFGQHPFVDFLIKPSFRAQRGTVRDLSIRGLGLIWSRHLEPDTVLAIHMQSATAAQSWMSVARVCYVNRLESGLWVMGCRFPRQLQESDISSIIDDEIVATEQDEIAEISDSELFAMLLRPRPVR